MGIVVLVFMVLGILHQSPIKWFSLGALKYKPLVIQFIGSGLLLVGLWNVFWFGVRHLTVFWGIAALISGFFMIMTALVILAEHHSQFFTSIALKKIVDSIKPLLALWLVGLSVSSVLYGVTIIQLNLGLPIID